MAFTNEDTTLTIRSICKECDSGPSNANRLTDVMVIQCNSSNDYGYKFGQGYINVLSKQTYFFQ